jgi:aspartyl protease
MRFPYRTAPGPGGTTLYYPFIPVRIAGFSGASTRYFEALVDSGAADCIFQTSLASALRLDVQSGIPSVRAGIGGGSEVWVHPITLFVAGHVLQLNAAFSDTLPLAGLLGRSGFFEYFRITFDPASAPPGLELERVHKA